jgi:hypothetical protein
VCHLEYHLHRVGEVPDLGPGPPLLYIRSDKKMAYEDPQDVISQQKLADIRYDRIAVYPKANIEKGGS